MTPWFPLSLPLSRLNLTSICLPPALPDPDSVMQALGPTCIQGQALLLISCVTLGRLLNLSEYQFPHCKKRTEINSVFQGDKRRVQWSRRWCSIMFLLA